MKLTVHKRIYYILLLYTMRYAECNWRILVNAEMLTTDQLNWPFQCMLNMEFMNSCSYLYSVFVCIDIWKNKTTCTISLSTSPGISSPARYLQVPGAEFTNSIPEIQCILTVLTSLIFLKKLNHKIYHSKMLNIPVFLAWLIYQNH